MKGFFIGFILGQYVFSLNILLSKAWIRLFCSFQSGIDVVLHSELTKHIIVSYLLHSGVLVDVAYSPSL